MPSYMKAWIYVYMCVSLYFYAYMLQGYIELVTALFSIICFLNSLSNHFKPASNWYIKTYNSIYVSNFNVLLLSHIIHSVCFIFLSQRDDRLSSYFLTFPKTNISVIPLLRYTFYLKFILVEVEKNRIAA